MIKVIFMDENDFEEYTSEFNGIEAAVKKILVLQAKYPKYRKLELHIQISDYSKDYLICSNIRLD